jgi:hypothetical protein
MQRGFRVSAVALAATVSFLVFAAPGIAFAQAQSRQQQKCINAVNKASTGLANAYLKMLSGCNRDAGGAGVTSVQACVMGDARSSIGKSQVKLSLESTKACMPGQLPDFAYTSTSHADTLSLGETYARELVDVFGSAWGTFVKGTAEEACTTPAVKALHQYVGAQLKEFNSCKRAALKSGTIGATELAAACGTALPAVGFEALFTSECDGANLAAVFQGACSGDVAAASACMEASAKCAVCNLTAGVDDLPVDCDALDDGLANSSCERDDYLAGRYAGMFGMSAPAVAGTLDVSLSQVGSSLTGGMIIAVAPADEAAFTACYGVNPVSGTFVGGVGGETINGSVTLSNANNDVIHLTGTMSGGTISGTFDQTAGSCASTGTWSATAAP